MRNSKPTPPDGLLQFFKPLNRREINSVRKMWSKLSPNQRVKAVQSAEEYTKKYVSVFDMIACKGRLGARGSIRSRIMTWLAGQILSAIMREPALRRELIMSVAVELPNYYSRVEGAADSLWSALLTPPAYTIIEPLREGYVRKGGMNPPNSQVLRRPPPPPASRPARRRKSAR